MGAYDAVQRAAGIKSSMIVSNRAMTSGGTLAGADFERVNVLTSHWEYVMRTKLEQCCKIA